MHAYAAGDSHASYQPFQDVAQQAGSSGVAMHASRLNLRGLKITGRWRLRSRIYQD